MSCYHENSFVISNFICFILKIKPNFTIIESDFRKKRLVSEPYSFDCNVDIRNQQVASHVNRPSQCGWHKSGRVTTRDREIGNIRTTKTVCLTAHVQNWIIPLCWDHRHPTQEFERVYVAPTLIRVACFITTKNCFNRLNIFLTDLQKIYFTFGCMYMFCRSFIVLPTFNNVWVKRGCWNMNINAKSTD